jgi:hypothetical protein
MLLNIKVRSFFEKKQREGSLRELYKSLNSEKYKNLTKATLKKIRIFENTYLCAKSFFTAKINTHAQGILKTPNSCTIPRHDKPNKDIISITDFDMLISLQVIKK